MKLSALTLMALATSALALKTEYKCETSEASPMVHHVEWIIDNLRNGDPHKSYCNFYSLDATHCGDTITDYSGKGGGAAFTLCKGDSDKNKQSYRVSFN